MKKILFATNNKGKAREFKKILSDLQLEVLTLNDFDFNEDILEAGSTYEENAAIKAKKGGEVSGLISFGDDTGMEVDALNGFPGLHSKRFASGTDNDRNKLILEKLKDIPGDKRNVKYIGVIAIYNPNTQETEIFRGELSGIIALKPRGKNGFGYDPIFYLPKYKKTVAELSDDKKNKISHRQKALIKAKECLKKTMNL